MRLVSNYNDSWDDDFFEHVPVDVLSSAIKNIQDVSDLALYSVVEGVLICLSFSHFLVNLTVLTFIYNH